MKDINLLSQKKDTALLTKKVILFLRGVAIILLFLVASTTIGLFFLKLQSPLGPLKNQEKLLISNLSLSEQKIIKRILTTDRLKTINEVIEKRPYFDKMINLILENLIASQSTIESLSLEKKQIKLQASSYSLLDIQTVLNNFVTYSSEKKILGNVILNNIALDPKSGKFIISIDASVQ